MAVCKPFDRRQAEKIASFNKASRTLLDPTAMGNLEISIQRCQPFDNGCCCMSNFMSLKDERHEILFFCFFIAWKKSSFLSVIFIILKQDVFLSKKKKIHLFRLLWVLCPSRLFHSFRPYLISGKSRVPGGTNWHVKSGKNITTKRHAVHSYLKSSCSKLRQNAA